MYIDEQTKVYGNLNNEIPIEIKLPVLSLIVSLAIILIFAIPKYKEVKMAEIQVGLMEKNIEMKEDVVKKIINYNEINKDLKDEDIEKFVKLLPKENNIEEHLANIGNLAIVNRIVVDDFSVHKSNKSAKMVVGGKSVGLKEINAEFSSSGSFADTMSFIDCLERSIPLININNLEINKKEKDKKDKEDEEDEKTDENVRMESNVSFSFYYL